MGLCLRRRSLRRRLSFYHFRPKLSSRWRGRLTSSVPAWCRKHAKDPTNVFACPRSSEAALASRLRASASVGPRSSGSAPTTAVTIVHPVSVLAAFPTAFCRVPARSSPKTNSGSPRCGSPSGPPSPPYRLPSPLPLFSSIGLGSGNRPYFPPPLLYALDV